MRPFLLLLALAACGPQKPLNKCSPSATPAGRPLVAVTFANTATDVDLQLSPAVFCSDGNPIATEVVTQVVSADNVTLAHTHSPPTSSNVRGYGTTISFTPPAPGVYFLEARFEPSLGTLRREVQVLVDRANELPGTVAFDGGLCDELSVLGDLVACRRAGTLSLISPDASVPFTGPALGQRSRHDELWWWSTTDVHHATRDGDGGLTLHTADLALGPGAVVATEGHLTQMNGADVFSLTDATDGGLEATSFTLAFALDDGGLARAGDVVGFTTQSRACAYTLATEDAAVTCLDLNGFTPLIGQDDVLWLRGDDTGVLAQVRVSQPAALPAFRLLDAQASTFTPAMRQSLPAFTWNGKLLTVRPDSLVLDAWQAPPFSQRTFVTPTHVIYQRTDEVLYFAR